VGNKKFAGMPVLTEKSKLAGLLVPVFALRREGDLGIGDTLAVEEAIDFCAETGFKVLQILPTHETVGDHSPYNAISARALSPALLSLVPGEVPGLSTQMLSAAAPESWLAQLRAGSVKHRSVQPLKHQILLAAHARFSHEESPGSPLKLEFEQFKQANGYWLNSYSLFRLLIHQYEGNPNCTEWRPEHRTVSSAENWQAQHPSRTVLSGLRDGLCYIQWIAWRQWRKVRAHADQRGVLLMGELSFTVGRCSADVWSQPQLFDLDWNMGTRPLAYFDTNKDSERWGQNWGLPVYRWENHRSDKFAWLRDRVAGEKQFFHLCRLDHLRGYFRAYMFPWGGGGSHAQFASLGLEEARLRTGGRLPRFVPGPDDDPTAAKMNSLQGKEILSVIQETAGDMGLVAEIMGEIPDYMRSALEEMDLPSLTFPQLERKADRSLDPSSAFRVLSLVTYANHDHAPLAALWLHLTEEAKQNPNGPMAVDQANLLRFIGWSGPAPETFDGLLLAAFQKALFDTPCVLAVLLVSDLLGTSVRFNLPGTYGEGTWCERMELSLADCQTHAVYGPRIDQVKLLLAQSGRILHSA
jgi:4-alpha-glucanotransferase